MTVLVRSDVRRWVLPLLVDVSRGRHPVATRFLAGGRGGSALYTYAEGEVVLRTCRRGGLPAYLMHDAYVGCRPRPFRELGVTDILCQRGAPVIEVYGAAVRWRLPGLYNGWLATRFFPAARTLWQWASARPGPAERIAGFRQVGRAVAALHCAGGHHPDLNLNNILIGPRSADGVEPKVVLIDFDRARLAQGSPQQAEADLQRLTRSARKLDPGGAIISVADLDAVRAAYREGTTCG